MNEWANSFSSAGIKVRKMVGVKSYQKQPELEQDSKQGTGQSNYIKAVEGEDPVLSCIKMDIYIYIYINKSYIYSPSPYRQIN